MTKKTQYKIGEVVRVLHILEAVQAGVKVYMMGPKAVYDEYLDGKLVKEHPKVPPGYRGILINNRPIADFNYEITSYTFSKVGKHTIQWRGGGYYPAQGPLGLASNIITLEVVK